MTLYMTDLDGTLLDNSGKLKPRTADMLNSFIANGTLFSYCTARGIATAGEITKRLKLRTPVSVMNGVFIYDPVTGECPVRNVFTKKQAELLRKAITENEETPMVFSVIDGRERLSYIENSGNLRNFLARRKGDKRRRPLSSYDGMFDGEIYYTAFINPKNKPELDRIFCAENGFMCSYYTDTYDVNDNWYEIFPITAGKANSVRKIKELTGADELVVFGDNANDIPMFGAADRKYAVENAIPELKKLADGVIGSNEHFGVPEFIEKEIYPVFPYTRPEPAKPDNERFAECVAKALSRERTTIGTLNEKAVHHTLKCYYCDEADHEAKIGDFYADAAGENGIYEVQSANFSYLAKKLPQMLSVSHVTVIYPFGRITHNNSINEQTGEVMSVTKRTENSYSKLFLELYRLKAFITNPNLTIIISFLELDKKTFYKDERKLRRRGMKKEKIPVKLLGEVRLDCAEDYKFFLPEGLPEHFTKAELQKLLRSTDASLMLSVLEFTGTVRRVGKKGNSIIYKITGSE